MVSRYIDKYVTIISDYLGPIYIRFPVTEEEITAIKLDFEEKMQIPGIIGLIDGAQVGLSGVPSEIEIPFVNRKHVHSINVQIVCDSNMLIRNINARFPGSTHDSYVFRNSRVLTFLQHYHVTHANEWTWLIGKKYLNQKLLHHF